MKKLRFISTLLLLCMLLCACTNTHDDPIDTTDVPDTSAEPATDTLPAPAGEMYPISYKITEAICEFDWDKKDYPEYLQISMMLPSHIVNTENTENCGKYMVYNDEYQNYINGFDMRLALRFDQVIMNEDLYTNTFSTPIEETVFADGDITFERLDSGYKYLMYEKHIGNKFYVNIFIKLTRNYVLNIDYTDSEENYEYLEKILDSIKVTDPHYNDPDQPDMYEAAYTVTSAMANFDLNNTVTPEDLQISMMLPLHIKNTAGEDNCERYGVFDTDRQNYSMYFDFYRALYVGPDFVMDETIHSKADVDDSRSYVNDDSEIKSGTLANGYDYIMYEKIGEDSFNIFIYIRLTDEYILSIDYDDSLDNYEFLYRILDSIKLKV